MDLWKQREAEYKARQKKKNEEREEKELRARYREPNLLKAIGKATYEYVYLSFTVDIVLTFPSRRAHERTASVRLPSFASPYEHRQKKGIAPKRVSGNFRYQPYARTSPYRYRLPRDAADHLGIDVEAVTTGAFFMGSPSAERRGELVRGRRRLT